MVSHGFGLAIRLGVDMRLIDHWHPADLNFGDYFNRLVLFSNLSQVIKL